MSWHSISLRPVPFSPGSYVLRIGRWSFRFDARLIGHTLLLLAMALTVGILSLKSGARTLTFAEII